MTFCLCDCMNALYPIVDFMSVGYSHNHIFNSAEKEFGKFFLSVQGNLRLNLTVVPAFRYLHLSAILQLLMMWTQQTKKNWKRKFQTCDGSKIALGLKIAIQPGGPVQ